MYYIIILVLLFLAELFYFRIADKCNIIDKPNERSSHTRITLRGGGIIFYFGVLAYFLTSHFEYPWFMLALTLITFISFVDDITGKTLGTFPEIEEVENKDTAKHRQNKILFYERNDRLIDISKGYENNQ